jgi:hypothetical protein
MFVHTHRGVRAPPGSKPSGCPEEGCEGVSVYSTYIRELVQEGGREYSLDEHERDIGGSAKRLSRWMSQET